MTGTAYRTIQIVTVAELLAGKRPKMPPAILPYIQASPKPTPRPCPCSEPPGRMVCGMEVAGSI